MWNRSRTSIAIGLVLAAGFAAGLVQLLAMRAQSGAHYPPYSTFRADPLGTRAFFDALRAMPGVRAERSLAPIRALGGLRNATCLFLGDSPSGTGTLPESVFESVEEIPARGGRLVIAFAPEAREAMWNRIERESEEARRRARRKASEQETGGDGEDAPEAASDEEEARGIESASPEPRHDIEEAMPLEEEPALTAGEDDVPGADTAGDEAEPDDDEAEDDETERMRRFMRWVSLRDRWGVSLAYTSLEPDGRGGYVPLTAERALDDERLPERMTWHSAMYFENPGEAWRTVYRAEGRAVVIERDLGSGTIVLLSDSFPFSNEALRHMCQPKLLAWVIGENRHVVFDETHLGIREASGVMILARQYRMHGLFLGLIVVALLYVWQSTCPLTPRYEARDEGEIVVQAPGRDAISGLANLLKRSIPQRELLSVCLEQWKQAFGRSPRIAEKLKGAETIAARAANASLAGGDSAQAYRDICGVLTNRGQ